MCGGHHRADIGGEKPSDVVGVRGRQHRGDDGQDEKHPHEGVQGADRMAEDRRKAEGGQSESEEVRTPADDTARHGSHLDAAPAWHDRVRPGYDESRLIVGRFDHGESLYDASASIAHSNELATHGAATSESDAARRASRQLPRERRRADRARPTVRHPWVSGTTDPSR